jgi:hypothetical protein
LALEHQKGIGDFFGHRVPTPHQDLSTAKLSRPRQDRRGCRSAAPRCIRPVKHQIRADVRLEEIAHWLDPATRHSRAFEEPGIQCLFEARAYVNRGAKLVKPSRPLATGGNVSDRDAPQTASLHRSSIIDNVISKYLTDDTNQRILQRLGT